MYGAASATFTVTVRFSAASYSSALFASSTACVSVTVSSIRSPSSSPVTVTVCAVFQLVVPNVSAAGATLAASASLLATCTTTVSVGT